MGIPLYFKTITDEYDNIIIDTKQVPKVKRLFLDLNCAIHPCCRRIISEGYNASKKNTYENRMLTEIVTYINLLYNTVKPTELMYIAIDGVAPMAKMAQQRLRRYKTVKERNIKNDIKKSLNEPYDTDFWDTNAITPGTSFINKISNKIKEEINKNDYKTIDIIFSDSSVVGEGEHKIFNYIRNNYTDGIDVVYGLDADLIMLSLASRKESIYLLRESLEFGKMYYESGYKFLYLNIDELKNYIIMDIKGRLLGNYSYDDKLLLSLIDDYVVMCYILGNDFLPHLPSLSIRNNGLEILLDKYVHTYHELGTTLVDVVTLKINTKFLRSIIYKLSELEDDLLKKMVKKRDKFTLKYKKYDTELEKRLDLLHNYPILNNKELESYVNIGEKDWETRYYDKCFGINEKSEIEEVCNNYLEGILWTFNYYYKDCISWQWMYNYKHAPTLKDLSNYLNKLDNINNIKINKGTANKPYQQLLMVLPPESYTLLPKSYQHLVLLDSSPIIDYFPKEYEIDCYYKRYYWECTPILPLINIKRVRKILSKINLTKLESSLNKVGSDYLVNKSIQVI